jgi:hypothetical protein
MADIHRTYQLDKNLSLKKTVNKILSFMMVVVFLVSVSLTQWVYSSTHGLHKNGSGIKTDKVHDTPAFPLSPEPINSEETTDGETFESLEISDDDIVLSSFLHFLYQKLGERNFSKIVDQTSGIRCTVPFFILFHSWKGFLN